MQYQSFMTAELDEQLREAVGVLEELVASEKAAALRTMAGAKMKRLTALVGGLA